MRIRLTIVLLIPVAFVSAVFASQTGRSESDTAFVSSRSIEEISVNARRTTSLLRLSQTGALRMDMGMTAQMPHILGNADPVRFMQTLPGVQTNNEYDAGLHIQGCENGHNHVAINGVPVYNPNHLLGFFSAFIPTHFSAVTLEKSPQSSTLANRLGGFLDMETAQDIPDSSHLHASVGPMSSQGSLHTAVGRHSALTLSARASYLNWLYGPLLEMDGQRLKYAFGDLNATWLLQAGEQDRLWLDFYTGHDQGELTENKYESHDQISWGNMLGALHWEHLGPQEHVSRHSLYASYYYNKLNVQFEDRLITLPSGILTLGYRSSLRYGRLLLGWTAEGHLVRPQYPSLGSTELPVSATADSSLRALEVSEYIEWQPSLEQWILRAGLRLNQYTSFDRHLFFHADPSLSVGRLIEADQRLVFSYSYRHQYLFQSGFSSVGFPTEFWYPSGAALPPQSAHMLSLSYTRPLFKNDYSLSAEIYYKHLEHQLEFDESVFAMLSPQYRPEEAFLPGRGYNCGLNVMLNKRTGRLHAWLSYSYTLSRRRFYDRSRDYWFPSVHERPHELNLVMSYRIDRHWQLGGTMVYASGTPFTAPEHFYYVNGNVITQFSRHNANRLGAYGRTDLSLNYFFPSKGRRESGLNFSLYNTLRQKNRIYYRLKFNEGGFAYVPVHFVVEVMPSVNYFITF